MDYPTTEIASPPTPGSSATAADWANYLAFVRLQDERARWQSQLDRWAAADLLTADSTRAQLARAEAEQAVAAAGQAAAQAQIKAAEAMTSPHPGATPTAEETALSQAAADAHRAVAEAIRELAAAGPGAPTGGGVPTDVLVAIVKALAARP